MASSYGSKTGMAGDDKLQSSKSMPMIKAGSSGGSGGDGGPTGSSRSYPKGGSVSMSADFNPMKDRKRGGTDWAVGGVGS